jgi:hypothetical protein
MNPPTNHPMTTVDWPMFVAQGCQDIKDGVTAAFINAAPLWGHTAIVSFTGVDTTLGSSGQNLYNLYVEFLFQECSPTNIDFSVGLVARLKLGQSVRFAVGFAVQAIAFLAIPPTGDGSSSSHFTGLTYSLTFSHS